MADPFNALARFLLEGSLRLDPGRQESQEDAKWAPGTRLVGEVRAIIDPTRALLQIGAHVVDARLPIPVKVGERVPLRVVELFPKLVFALDPEEAPPASRTQVSISSAARVIAEVIRTTELGQAGKPLRLTEALPRAHGMAPQPEEIARSLKQAVERSGLFYEKHQARWISGDYPLAELAREPQAKLHRPSATPNPSLAPMASREPALLNDSLDAMPVAEKTAVAARDASVSRTSPEAPLRAQLELLDGRPVLVAMPGWERQDIHWELPQRERGGEAQAEEIWSTQLHLSFPRLGAVSAHLRLIDDKLTLALTTAYGETRSELAARQDALMDALKGAGLNLSGLAVTQRHG